MIEKITGIVTDVLKYSDRRNIVTLFTRERGRVALLSSAGTGKSARLRGAALMPLSLVSADVNFSATRDLQFLGSFSRPRLWHDIYFNPLKSSVGMFVAEFLNVFMRQSPPDPAMWDYVVDAIARLDSAERGVSNFHLAFLVEFMSYAGIRPDLSDWRSDAWFDMRGGTMVLLPPAHRDVVIPAEAGALPLLLRMNMRNMHLYRFKSAERRDVLRRMLHYYSLHFPGMSALKSPAVLEEVFS